MSARGDRYIKNKLFYEGKWKTLLINFEEFEPASILCLYMNSRHWTFIFHGFFFTLRLFQSFNCEKKPTFTLCNRKLHFNPLFCKLIRNAPGVYSIQHMSSFPGLFANSWPPPPILLFFRRCPYLPFSEINIKMTFILGHSYFKGIYSVYVEDGLCITLMDSKGQLLLNELSN